VGIGSGMTVAAALAAGAGPTDVMEIEPAVVEASRFFDEPGRAPLADPRVRLIVGDARTRFFNARETYDVIVSEPSNPWIAGVNNLFTVDFYRRVRERLAPRGVFCQWIQLYELSPETLASLLASFLRVFPTGQAFYITVAQDLFLVAAPPGTTLPLERVRDPGVVRQLLRGRQLAAESVAAWYACPFDSLRALARGAPLNTDDRPAVEYRAPRDMFRVGWSGASAGYPSRVPQAGWRAARAVFADWPAGTWYESRVRQLLAARDDQGALATARDAAAEGLPDLAVRLQDEVRAANLEFLATRAVDDALAGALAGNQARARDILLAALRQAPRSARAWLLLAQVTHDMGDDAAALEAAGRSFAFGDSALRSDARLIEGRIAVTRGRMRDAAAAFTDAARWDPASDQGWLFAAQALRQAGDPAAAAALCRRGLASAREGSRLRALLAGLEGSR